MRGVCPSYQPPVERHRLDMSEPETPDEEKKLDWVVKDVCDWFEVSRWTVYDWMKKEGEEQIPHYRPGGGIPRFSSEEVKEWGVSQ